MGTGQSESGRNEGTRVYVGVGGAQRLTEASWDTAPHVYKTPGCLKEKGVPQQFLWAREGGWFEVRDVVWLLSP